MAPLRIHLLGGFLVEDSSRHVPPIPSPVARSLLAYLITYRDRRHTRDLLAGTFWPDQSESSARKRLSQTLWQINTALEETGSTGPLIQVTHSDVAFDASANFWLDVVEFGAQIGRAADQGELDEIRSLETAVQVYRGDFLAGFYDDWILMERQRLSEQYMAALERLVALHKGRADYATALSYARRLTLHDPLREDAHREVMRLCFLLGRSTEALRQYERCEAILAEELGAQPAAETRRLRTQIAELRDKGERPFSPSVEAPLLRSDRRIPLVGRDTERVSVIRHMEDTLVGSGGSILIEGDPGIGKTRLLQELAEDADWRGLNVLWAECREDEQLHPFSVLRRSLEMGLTTLRVQQLAEVLDPVAVAELARVVPSIREKLPELPALPTLRPEETRERVHHALRRALLALGEMNPQVVFFDDLQWIDEESIAVLTEIAGDLEYSGILVCLSFRGGEARDRAELWQHLRAIDEVARSDRLVLGSLTSEESARLVQESLGVTTVSPDVAEGLYLETGGNPLFLIETLRTWHDESRELIADGPPEEALTPGLVASDLPVAGGVAQVIARRFATLSGEVRHTLEAAAVLGRVPDPGALALLVGDTKLEVLKALEELVRKGAVVESRDGYEFAHYQIRRVALDGIGSEELLGLHRSAGEALEERSPEGVEDLAYHFDRGEVPNKAARYAAEAGRRAVALAAFDTAAQHYERMHTWLPASEIALDEQFTLLGEWEAVLNVLGRREDQHTAIAEMHAVAGGEADKTAETWRRTALVFANEGNSHDAIAAAETALSAIGPDAPGHGSVTRTYGFVLSQAGRHVEAVPWLEEAVAAETADNAAAADAGSDLASALIESQEYERAAIELATAVERYEGLGDQRGLAEIRGRMAILSMERGDVPGAIDAYGQALAVCRDIGYRRGEAVNLVNLGNALYVLGELGSALVRYDEAATSFSAIGDRRGAALVQANAGSVRHAVLGDPAAEDQVHAALGFFRSEEHAWGEAFCHQVLARIARDKGHTAAARRHVEAGLELLEGGGHRWVEVHLLRVAAQVALDAGAPEAAEKHIDRALATCEELGLADVLPTVLGVAVRVALAKDQGDRAVSLARTATEQLTPGADQPYIAWYRRSEAAETTGRLEEAAETLARAHELLEETIATLDSADRPRSLENVPEHRAIVAAWARTRSQRVEALVPSVAAPIGRPLRPEDMVAVTWTASAPDDLQVIDDRERRRIQLLRLVGEADEQGGAPRVQDLAAVLGVSPVTVRRDLNALRAAGHELPTTRRSS